MSLMDLLTSLSSLYLKYYIVRKSLMDFDVNSLCYGNDSDKRRVGHIPGLVVGGQHEHLIRQLGPGVVLVREQRLQGAGGHPPVEEEGEAVHQHHVDHQGLVHPLDPQHGNPLPRSPPIILDQSMLVCSVSSFLHSVRVLAGCQLTAPKSVVRL